MEQAVYVEATRLHKQAHRDIFPLFQNLIALTMTRSETSIMTHRNRTMNQYRMPELREVFIEMFCTVKRAVDNPMMNASGSGGRRAFSRS